MTNKKKIKKGLNSLEKQIEIHEEKMKTAREKGKIELEGYYVKEIESLKKAKRKRERRL